MHDDITAFRMEGQIDGTNKSATKARLVRELEESFRENESAVPVLDIDPSFSLDLREDGTYDFKLTIYGVRVEDEWTIAGWSNGRTQPSTAKIKSTQSSTD